MIKKYEFNVNYGRPWLNFKASSPPGNGASGGRTFSASDKIPPVPCPWTRRPPQQLLGKKRKTKKQPGKELSKSNESIVKRIGCLNDSKFGK